jgi:hypothetical protein
VRYRRHHPDDIVIVNETIEEAYQGHPDVAGTFKSHMRRVEKDDEGP